jgi:ubiquinol-cytochrome c reductase iron-sulfur subunit
VSDHEESGELVASVPHHPARRTDVDPRADQRAEREVATMFGLAAITAIASVVAFFAIDPYRYIYVPVIGETNANNVAFGALFGLSMSLIGAGAIHWARKLMPAQEVVSERHDLPSDPSDRAEAVAVFEEGAEGSGFGSRKIIRRSLIGAMALFPIPLLVILRGLGPKVMDPQVLGKTIWKRGELIVTDPTQRKLRPEDIPVGGLVNAVPEGLREVEELAGNLNARAKAGVILVRMAPGEIRSQQGDGWDYQGILAFSKICTHVGCPISLYQQRTHHLLCPCHQSTFDLADAGSVVFGPARRELPQLPITVNAEGFLVAASEFQQPIGPSFWERTS